MNFGKFRKNLFSFRETGDTSKPFLDHLEDLRRMLIKSIVVLAVFMMLGFTFRSQIARFVQHPLAAVNPKSVDNLQSLGVADSMMISFDLAFYAGIVLAFPFLLYFLAEFILPGLTPREKKAALPAALVGFGLFLSGAAFAYYELLPQTLEWFYADAKSMGWVPTWTVHEYYSFATQFIIAFGLAAELPVVILVLVRIGILNTAKLRKLRPYMLILVTTFAAVIVPTTDVLTLVLMAAPMYLLYEISILLAHWMEKKTRSTEVLEAPAEIKDSSEESDK
ncbi:MAG: twin-arginine translocase subunit TatC [Chthoniobacterales bacterium]